MRRAGALERLTRCSSVVASFNGGLRDDTRQRSYSHNRPPKVDPSFWIGHGQLAAVYEQLGNSELALKALDEADVLSANSKGLSFRGYILAKSGRTSEAEQCCVGCKASLPTRRAALFHSAGVRRTWPIRPVFRGSIAPILFGTCISSAWAIIAGTRFAKTHGLCAGRTLRLHAHGENGWATQG